MTPIVFYFLLFYTGKTKANLRMGNVCAIKSVVCNNALCFFLYFKYFQIFVFKYYVIAKIVYFALLKCKYCKKGTCTLTMSRYPYMHRR